MLSFIANALGGTTTTTSFGVSLPATQEGDIIILEFAHRGTGDGTIGGTWSGPAFTLKHSQLFGSSAFSGKTYYSRATKDHSVPIPESINVSGLTNSCAGFITIYRGALASGDPLADATVVGEQNASGDETQAQITTATDGAWPVLVVVNSPDRAVTSQACTSPGTLTARAERLSTGGTDSSIAHASAEKATAGATGAFTWAQTNAESGSWAYAIKPEPTGVSGTIAVTTANATSAASGTVTVSGTIAASAANATSAANGTVTVSGSITAAAANATASANGTVTVSGTVAATAADATGNASGTVGAAGITGSVASTAENAAASASGAVTVSGTIAAAAANATSTASGVVTVSGTVSATAANATSSASGIVTVSGSVAATAANATANASGSVSSSGTISATAADAAASASGTVSGGPPVTGTIAAVLADATASATGTSGTATEPGVAVETNIGGQAAWVHRDVVGARGRAKRLKKMLEEQAAAQAAAQAALHAFQQRNILKALQLAA